MNVLPAFTYLPQHGNGLVETARDHGIETVLTSAPAALQSLLRKYLGATGKPGRTNPGYLTVLSTSTDLMTDQILRSRLAGDPPNVMVDLDLHDMTVLDFAKAEKAITHGYDAMMDKAGILDRIF